jgi:hypothetical protein
VTDATPPGGAGPDGGPHLVAVALGGVLTGAGAGAAVITAGLLGLRERLSNTLSIIVFVGIVVAAVTGWTLAAPLPDQWRRGVTAALAVFGALMLAVLAAPVDMAAGQIGLTVYLSALLAFALLGRTVVRKAAGK